MRFVASTGLLHAFGAAAAGLPDTPTTSAAMVRSAAPAAAVRDRAKEVFMAAPVLLGGGLPREQWTVDRPVNDSAAPHCRERSGAFAVAGDQAGDTVQPDRSDHGAGRRERVTGVVV
ncbi:hypothetical protein Ais01nite_54050 [Asanoa ishikariensis]|nr:hypothetical protein Ais01nite_54050 [Asanoa ishikariensis]